MNELVVGKPVLKDRIMTSKVTASKRLSKYLNRKELLIEYDANIGADESILNIPLTAAILPLAWLTGSNIKVGKLDRTFKESMDALQDTFTKMYPLASFKSKIYVQELIENKIKPINPKSTTALSFSGGVDSSYSLIKNMRLKPRLVMMWGIDNFPYPEHSDHWEETLRIYKEYSKRKKLEFNVIKTNVTEILDNRRIEHTYHKELYYGDLRPSISHSMILLPIAAPLSVGRFNDFIIAASYTKKFDFSYKPRAAVASVDEKIVWADLKVRHDGCIDRMDKTKALVPSLRDDMTLRVCIRSNLADGKINDNTCEKCLRTICFLTLAGADPNKCGFNINMSTFNGMRYLWENMKTSRTFSNWRNIQKLIPDKLEHDFHGSKEFFEWFRGFDFESTEKNWFYTDLYMRLPFRLAKILDTVYRKLGINVHEYPYNREEKKHAKD